MLTLNALTKNNSLLELTVYLTSQEMAVCSVIQKNNSLFGSYSTLSTQTLKDRTGFLSDTIEQCVYNLIESGFVEEIYNGIGFGYRLVS